MEGSLLEELSAHSLACHLVGFVLRRGQQKHVWRDVPVNTEHPTVRNHHGQWCEASS